MLIQDTMFALMISSFATLLALFIFGFVKAKIFGTPRPFFSAFQMAIVGGAAAACAFGIAKLVPQPSL
jgi:VIT1/CCC1 family predicted Fe2+/Mn2+ transporter